ncbi:peptidyl-tRNA hydrolase [Chanos chanos]|uniref:peptidyl-tRNA hydrolase n=1 Tax=Chanos chanos TaxID=29144 RepID=A0A6J2WU13_CHACN|nr:probable peptidyl-tRNA hydrolase [Chanos chanos]
MTKVTLGGKVWTFATNYCRLLIRVMKRIVTKLINRMLLNTVDSERMASDITLSHVRKKMFVGLGNPGMNGSRHSVGMTVVEALAKRLGVSDSWRTDRQVSGEIIVSEFQDTQLVLLRPKLLMNINGVSVAKAASKFSIEPEHILLIHDDLDKPLGKIAIKHGGSARGHNGVRSCVDCLQTDVMRRLRIGIGRPSGKTPVDRYVLGRFSAEERKVLSTVLDESVTTLLAQLKDNELQKSPPGGRRKSQRSEKKDSSTALDIDREHIQT